MHLIIRPSLSACNTWPHFAFLQDFKSFLFAAGILAASIFINLPFQVVKLPGSLEKALILFKICLGLSDQSILKSLFEKILV